MFELTPKTYEDFLAEAEKGNVVPVVRNVLADLHTPVGAFLRVCGEAQQAFLFESVEGGERLARYSFLAANPRMTVRSRGSEMIIERADAETDILPDTALFEFLRAHFRRSKLAVRENLPPLCGGAIGFLAYDAARWFEKTLENSGSALK